MCTVSGKVKSFDDASGLLNLAAKLRDRRVWNAKIQSDKTGDNTAPRSKAGDVWIHNNATDIKEIEHWR
jgi:hypothetical protein